jgi:hypothetical protein
MVYLGETEGKLKAVVNSCEYLNGHIVNLNSIDKSFMNLKKRIAKEKKDELKARSTSKRPTRGHKR